MPADMPSGPRANSAVTAAAVLVRALALAAILFLPVAILAGWLDKLGPSPERAGTEPVARTPRAFQRAVDHVRALPPRPESVALAAEATQEGHWRFRNRAGEIYAAGTPDEMKRAASVLHPAASPGARLSLYITADTLFSHRTALKSLPAGVDLHVVIGDGAYRLFRKVDGTLERYYAEVRPSIVAELTDRRLAGESVWQLERSLRSAKVRVLALEPGGASTLHGWPRIDPASKRAEVDVIDPRSLAAAMGAVRGQTLLLTARMEGDLLHVRPNSGTERSLPAKDLFKAAREAEVNLIILQAATTPRQPGGRNWFWQRVEVQGLEAAAQHAKLADLLNALVPSGRRFTAVALPLGNRTVLDLTSEDITGGSVKGQLGDFFYGVVVDMAGRVTVTGVQANMQSAARERELEQRLVPGIPSGAQLGYLALLFFGMIGIPVSRQWWLGIWPPESRDDYAGRGGYLAARAVRGAAFTFVFVPLTGIIAAPYNLAGQIRDAVTGPVRLWRKLTRRAPSPPQLSSESAVASPKSEANNLPKPPPAAPVPREPRLVFPKFLKGMQQKGRA
jgi:hypothetical protein